VASLAAQLTIVLQNQSWLKVWIWQREERSQL